MKEGTDPELVSARVSLLDLPLSSWWAGGRSGDSQLLRVAPLLLPVGSLKVLAVALKLGLSWTMELLKDEFFKKVAMKEVGKLS